MGWVIESVMDEMLDTLSETDSDTELAGYLELTSQIMHWVATGEDSDMPDEFRNRLELTAEKEILALPAGDAVIAH